MLGLCTFVEEITAAYLIQTFQIASFSLSRTCLELSTWEGSGKTFEVWAEWKAASRGDASRSGSRLLMSSPVRSILVRSSRFLLAKELRTYLMVRLFASYKSTICSLLSVMSRFSTTRRRCSLETTFCSWVRSMSRKVLVESTACRILIMSQDCANLRTACFSRCSSKMV